VANVKLVFFTRHFIL